MKLVRVALLLVSLIAGAGCLTAGILIGVLRFEPGPAGDIGSGLGFAATVLGLVAFVTFGAHRLLLARDRPDSPRRGTRRVVGIAAYLLFLLFLVEGGARVAFRAPALADRLWANESSSWRRAWVMQHSGGQPLAFAFDQYDATKGWVSRPGIRDAEVFGTKRLNTNSQGSRGTREFAFEKDPARTRIVVLGDSFTFGEEVSDGEAWPSVLQERLPNADVINLGVHGYAHDQMAIHLEETGLRFHPDIVLLGFVQVDIDRNRLEFRDYAKPRFALDGAGLRLVNSPVPAPEEILAVDWARPRVLDLLSVLRYRVSFRNGWLEEEENEVTRRILDRIAGATAAAGAKPVFVHLPTGFEIAAKTGTARGEALLTEYAAKRPDVISFSARAFCRERFEAGVIQDVEGHWDAAGHAAVGEAVAEFLKARGLVD